MVLTQRMMPWIGLHRTRKDRGVHGLAKVIGFVGVDKHDVMLYLARLLSKSGRKVLLVDNSETQALHCSISYPRGLDPHKEAVEYGSFEFLSRVSLGNFDYSTDYDFVLVDFGFCTNHPDVVQCEVIELVTDLKKHNLLRLLSPSFTSLIVGSGDGDRPVIYLIFRDWVDCKLNKAYLGELMKGFQVSEEFQYQFYLDANDYTLQLLSQYDTIYQFRRVSAVIKDYLIDTLVKVFDFTREEAQKAYKVYAGGGLE